MAAYFPLLPFFIKYPFIKAARFFLDEEFRDIKEFLKSDNPVDVEAKKAGEQMVLSIFRDIKEEKPPEYSFICSACDEKECKSYCPKNAIGDEIDWNLCDFCCECFKHCPKVEGYEEIKFKAKESVLPFLYSRLLVSSLDNWVRRKYAVVMARRYREIIRREDASFKKYLLALLSADFKIKVLNGWNGRKAFRVHVSSYLKAPSRIKSEKWRLINKKLDNGYVEIEENDFIRLIEEFLKERLAEKLQIGDEIKKLIEPSLKTVEPVVFEEKRKAGQVKFEKTDTSCFPPCMVKILEDLKSGVNIPHTARFAVTSFLLNAGLDVEEVIALFRSAPDFNEEKTRYQVEHIAGAKGTEYDCPACDTMRTYHNCVKNCKTYHPLSFYENCMRKKSKTVKSYKPAE